tara:strand:- start:580 stop:1242 length:663 start_codon:yes stop_codon:yes gene_type:complete
MSTPALLQQRLPYHFTNEALLVQALTHKSVHEEHYEKLEFLGDSILNYVISSIIFQNRKSLNEGQLSMLRSKVVNKKALSNVAEKIQLHLFIKTKSSQAISQTIQADVIEAIIGAIYMDGGMDAVTGVIRHHFSPVLEYLENKQLKDAKSALQEQTHKQKEALPIYTITQISGKQHNRIYTISCKALSLEAQGEGSSKRQAEQRAAKKVLEQLATQREPI